MPLRSGQLIKSTAEFFIRSATFQRLRSRSDLVSFVPVVVAAPKGLNHEGIQRNVSVQSLARGENYFFKSFSISRAAFAPDPPVNPAPGCVPEPHKYKF